MSRAPALAGLVPRGVLVREVRTLDTTESLHKVEARVIRNAIPRRRREFATARRLAREAVASGGWDSGPILRGAQGEPLWPEGSTGSLTHCDGYVGAAVAAAGAWASVGIDAEPDAPLPDGVLRTIARPAELEQLAALDREHPGVAWDRLLFCLKEATYKAWFPLQRSWLGFDQAEMLVDPLRGTFTSRLSVPGPRVNGVAVQEFRGRWCSSAGVLICATAVPRARGASAA